MSGNVRTGIKFMEERYILEITYIVEIDFSQDTSISIMKRMTKRITIVLNGRTQILRYCTRLSGGH